MVDVGRGTGRARHSAADALHKREPGPDSPETDPKDSRRSLYHSQDVRRLACHHTGRRSAAAVAAGAIGWGDPVLASGVSTVAHERLWYRGQDAVTLSNTATLEEVTTLLWEAEDVQFGPFRNGGKRKERGQHPLRSALLALSTRVATDPPTRGQPRAALARDAASLVSLVACAMTGGPSRSLSLHIRMARAWNAPHVQDILRRALVLLADHELNASTFAARVAVSTGAPLSAGLIAGLSTLSGPLHGGASTAARALVRSAGKIGASEAVREWLARVSPLPAFAHPLYPEGDPRAVELLARFEVRPIFAELRSVVDSLTGEHLNVDFAIAAMADAYHLPPTAPFTIFAMARSVGCTAHILEQAAMGSLIPPRARYVGPRCRHDRGCPSCRNGDTAVSRLRTEIFLTKVR